MTISHARLTSNTGATTTLETGRNAGLTTTLDTKSYRFSPVTQSRCGTAIKVEDFISRVDDPRIVFNTEHLHTNETIIPPDVYSNLVDTALSDLNTERR